MKDWSLDFRQGFEDPRILDVLKVVIHSGVARFVVRKNAPLADKRCSSSLNGSYLEQMSYNRDGRLPLEVGEIWNDSFDIE